MDPRHVDGPAGCCADAPFDFPSAARAARHAARLWAQTTTGITAAQFRDQRFDEHCRGRMDSDKERLIRRAVFCQTFAEAVGRIVVDRS